MQLTLTGNNSYFIGCLLRVFSSYGVESSGNLAIFFEQGKPMLARESVRALVFHILHNNFLNRYQQQLLKTFPEEVSYRNAQRESQHLNSRKDASPQRELASPHRGLSAG